MIKAQFLISLCNSIKQKRYCVAIKTNKQVLIIINELIKLKLIRSIKKISTKKNYVVICFNFSIFKHTKVRLKYLVCKTSLKKELLTLILKKNSIFLLQTHVGIRNSFFCIKNNLIGVPFLQIWI